MELLHTDHVSIKLEYLYIDHHIIRIGYKQGKMIIHTLVYRNTFASASHYGWFWTFLSLYYLYAKPVEMSCFTIQIIISTHDTSFKKFCQKYENWCIFA